MQVNVTGAPTAIQVDLEGSIDGATYFQLATTSAVGGALVFSVDKPVRYWRARLVTLTGGTASTVTAYVIAAA